MKNLFSLSLILFFFVCCKSSGELVLLTDDIRKTDKEHRYTPPGTVWIKDSIYIDQCEIRNLDYKEYTHWTKKYDSVNYNKVLPDTLVWRDRICMNEPYTEYYFRHPSYNKYPVVGVSYEQALAFCKWRTDRVKEFAKKIPSRSKLGDTYKNGDFYYRLPTKEEWEDAASGEYTRQYGFVNMQSKDNSPNFNVKETYMLGYTNVGGDIIVPAMCKKPNNFGLYNTIGNLAEMIMDKGVSKGGSWNHSIADCEISDSIKYEKPTAWLGFRCVCVVTK